MFSLNKVTYLKIGYLVLPSLVCTFFTFADRLDKFNFFALYFLVLYFSSLPACLIFIPLIDLINNLTSSLASNFPYLEKDTIGFIIIVIILTSLGYFQWFILVPRIIKGIAWCVDLFWHKH